MARYNEILAGRFNRGLQKLFSMKGPSPSPQIASEIIAAVILENDRIEHLFLRNERYFGGTSHSGGAVGAINQFQLFNPTGSNILAVVQLVLMTADVGDRFVLTIDNAAQGAVQPAGTFMDTRYFKGQTFGTQASGLQLRFGQPAALTGMRIGEIDAVTLSSARWDQPVILSPGFGLNTQNVTLNVGSGVAFVWTERALEDSES
jgi:hypothetical protein